MMLFKVDGDDDSKLSYVTTKFRHEQRDISLEFEAECSEYFVFIYIFWITYDDLTYNFGFYGPQDEVKLIKRKINFTTSPEKDEFIKQYSDCIIQSLPEWYIQEVEEVPGVKFINNMNEMGYFWAKFDIQEPINF